ALLEAGIQPEILVLRTEKSLNRDIRRKVALFCNVDENAVIESVDVSTIYEVPLRMLEEKLDLEVLKKLSLPSSEEPPLTEWRDFLRKFQNPKHSVRIGLVGKYVELPDACKSINEAFIHAGALNECEVDVVFIHSEDITPDNVDRIMNGMKGILVAPG